MTKRLLNIKVTVLMSGLLFCKGLCLSENFLTREMQRKKGVAFATPKHTHIKRKISINY